MCPFPMGLAKSYARTSSSAASMRSCAKKYSTSGSTALPIFNAMARISEVSRMFSALQISNSAIGRLPRPRRRSDNMTVKENCGQVLNAGRFLAAWMRSKTLSNLWFSVIKTSHYLFFVCLPYNLIIPYVYVLCQGLALPTCFC